MPKGAKFGGRQRGTPNLKTQEVAEKLSRVGHDPVVGMALIAMGKVPCARCYKTGRVITVDGEILPAELCGNCHGTTFDPVSSDLRGRMNAELANYLYPKRKAVEVTGEEGGPIQHGIRVVYVDPPA